MVLVAMRRDFCSSSLVVQSLGSAVVSALPLCVFLPAVSAPEAAPKHMCPRRPAGEEVSRGVVTGADMAGRSFSWGGIAMIYVRVFCLRFFFFFSLFLYMVLENVVILFFYL